jgi:hypothetical protein
LHTSSSIIKADESTDALDYVFHIVCLTDEDIDEVMISE